MTEPFADVDLPERFRHVILRVEAGSTIHGINLPDGDDDRDELAVSVDPPPWVTGTRAGRESYMFRTAAEGEKSGPGDLDLIVHSLRKFARLAMGGNPTIIQTFYVPTDRLQMTELGAMLYFARGLFVSRQIARPYLGYLTQQRAALAGERSDGRGAKGGGRDPARRRKYAAHALRLGMQGLQLLDTGELALPMHESAARMCRRVRSGDIPIDMALDLIRRHEALLQEHARGEVGGPLPEAPDVDAVSRLLHSLHTATWAIVGRQQ